jgi:hypothetical protein
VIVDLQAEGAARRATAWPMRPMPTMPSRLPQMRWPSIQVGDQPLQCSASVSTAAPSTSRRGTARISAMVMSAVSSVSTPGVLVTVMPRSQRRRHVDIVDAVAEIGDQLQPLAGLDEHRAVDRWSVTVGTSTSAVLDGLDSSAWLIGLSSRLSRASNSSRMRVSIAPGSLRVTIHHDLRRTDRSCDFEVPRGAQVVRACEIEDSGLGSARRNCQAGGLRPASLPSLHRRRRRLDRQEEYLGSDRG